MKEIEKLLKEFQVETLFPKHYFPHLILKEFSKSDYLCHQDEELTTISYVLTGRIKIVKKLANGKDYILDIKNPPTIIGEIELLTNQTASSSVIAETKGLMLSLSLNQQKEVLLSDPSFLLRLARGLANALHEQNTKTSTNLSYTLKERLASYILTLEEDKPFTLPLATLADSFGVSYRHLLRVLKELITDGALHKENNRYRINDRKRLEKWQIHA